MFKDSEYFTNFFSKLENNANFVLIVTFGETVYDEKNNGSFEMVNSQYDPNNTTITFLAEAGLSGLVIIEEFYHAYQDMMSRQSNISDSWNREFEAKTIATIIAGQCGCPFPSNYFQGNTEYYKSIMDYTGTKFEFNGKFINNYIINGERFSDFWKKQNIKGYSEPVNQFPRTLFDILFD